MMFLEVGKKPRKPTSPTEEFSTRFTSRKGNGNSISMPLILKKRSILPGFGLAMGWTIFYLCLIVLIPVSTIFVKSASLTWPEFWRAVASPRALASYRLSFVASLVAALINGVFGLLVAWVLVRYRFPFRRLVDGL